ncbi:MAG: Eco57I restriction-modification methylase domain-containing protein [SAR324 cluster bacterium]|nr:Eco57I restriction-modification methylase domain-containing protein [SAR324 cluster bacterium]
MSLDYFENLDDFYTGLQRLFKSLDVPVNYIDEKSLKPQDVLSKTDLETHPSYQLMDDVYVLGMVDDASFDGNGSDKLSEIKKAEEDYDGILIFGMTLKKRENGLLPTRTQLAEITRAFNREFHYTPVVVVFRYENFISLANAERLKYKQEWREGEKAGKVSIIRDVDITNPHTGHLKILEELKITRSGKKGINTFSALYQYWQEVFSVRLLSKKFYSELSHWYFWAIKHVTFPSEPTAKSLKFTDYSRLSPARQEHNAENIIRLLTRLLFVWFIKEKKLVPGELFDLDELQTNILKKIEPEHIITNERENVESIYYKAILQNLFFATLNCPIKPDSIDSRERGFRGDESYGKHRGVDYLMRYKNYFKNPEAFLEMVNEVVPFLNGGLFECLDDKEKKIYIDGFSDNMTKGNTLTIPDFLFFGREEKTDLSSDYGVQNAGTKEAAVKGLINILKSYKFTVAENTPIEEDVALDPELLGKVFENLLASYNPETKTTARKQTGSFYTPREIVNYMVDESLIAHLKKSVSNWDMEGKELDKQLHKLVSFNPVNPFENNSELSEKIIHALDSCKILDPACGSGAFPMGILQKMVHILQKLDPDNRHWKERQREKAKSETNKAYEIDSKADRQTLLSEIDEAFDETINNPDYARKLFLIENSIYGVDIQPIAAQISKLRFFISLVVEQKVNWVKDNFGIRPLPNLETKFVTANTLIGMEKPEAQFSIFDTEAVRKFEQELKNIRHKLFGAKTKATKVKYRQRDAELRDEIAAELKKSGWGKRSAEQLASWDPYDQNGSAPFFDPEWMFDIKEGFDVVIGNPPYVQIQKFNGKQEQKDWQSQNYSTFVKTGDIFTDFEKNRNIFTEAGEVEVEFGFNNGQELIISADLEDMPDHVGFIKGLSIFKPMLDYKKLLKIHYQPHVNGEEINLYAMFSELLKDYPIDSDKDKRILSEIEDLQDYFSALKLILDNNFKESINSFLEDFFNADFSIDKFEYKTKRDKETNTAIPVVNITIDYKDHVIEKYHTFLNEARLSALAISLYFISIKKLLGEIKGENLKILVLDDLLISLDMSNRLKLLEILKNEFTDFQIFFFTHDKELYEVYKNKLNWKRYELYLDDHGEIPSPIIKQGRSEIERAKVFYASKDYDACARW